MNTTLIGIKTKNVIIKRFKGDIFLNDFIQSLHNLKDCAPDSYGISLIIDIRKTELKLNIAELNELVVRLNIEFLVFKKVSLILITSTPKQAALSYYLKHLAEKPRQEIIICSYFETAKKSIHKNTFLLS
jgi:hypothetical protein